MRLIHAYEDSYIFEEPLRKNERKNRLTIGCHGYGPRIPRVRINGQDYNPGQLSDSIKQWSEFNKLYSVRLIACYSANSKPSGGIWPIDGFPFSSSFGSQLSILLPNVFVKAYKGNIGTNYDPASIKEFNDDYGSEYTEDGLSDHFKVRKDTPNQPYHCVVFLNGQVYRQRYNPNTLLAP
ncbi:hypothetical protein [Xenorhabdus lircayensis]|uniref:Uncharacterized protein n=1 Tax=Xenorhabdus lircayensis TaxID=2763499 RepID=A0ABS0U499_9GAMM|nr:hypothetical protein [Xenorhabdus lircayensis]MBI6548704.1 hypothetical protein [Xenorhabdus lircayensis]